MRPVVALLFVLCGCLRPNPGFDGASESAGATTTAATTTTTTTVASTTTTGLATTEPITTGIGVSDSSTTLAITSTSTSTSTSTGEPATTDPSTTTGFDPVTLRPYDPASCIDGPFCTSMGNPVPAAIEAYECFTAPGAPLQLLRIGFEIRHSLGDPATTLDILPFDAVADQPVLQPLATRDLGPVGPSMTYASYELDPPVLLDSPEFCVRIAAGDADTTLALNTDHDGMASGSAYVTIDDPGDFCDTPLTDLRDWYDEPFAHYCIDVDIAPA
ncbi:hypothetical protein [Nannocystis sp. SCPEA4]|uniref:hypothetical protein n=1 Tax=Nannocystis sp. SCPEA4 TaxID=2996787 RepID=UPI00226D8E74|nr:hypothetical protein [Nannocystis sp. SCPEA4]MCY1057485.1 hypothetical protein [Nannocystis sp. SCPEA4]